MNTAKPAVAPGYAGDDVDDTAILTATVAGSNLPQAVVAYAQTAETQEGEAVAAVLVIDASGSMEGVRKAVVEGLNGFRKVITTSHERRKMHIRIIFFNTTVMPWEPFGPDSPFLTALDGDPNFIPEITMSIYRPDGYTSLYKANLEGLAAADLLATELESGGNDVRRIVAVISDGLDNQSSDSDLAQLRQAVNRRKVLEGKWTFIFFGFIDPELLNYVGDSLGGRPKGDDERDKMAERLFRAVACDGSDAEMNKALRSLQPGAVLGGMGFPEKMVAVFPRDPDTVRDVMGVKLSTTFVKASAGKINVNAPIAGQLDPNAQAPDPAGSSGTSFV